MRASILPLILSVFAASAAAKIFNTTGNTTFWDSGDLQIGGAITRFLTTAPRQRGWETRPSIATGHPRRGWETPIFTAMERRQTRWEIRNFSVTGAAARALEMRCPATNSCAPVGLCRRLKDDNQPNEGRRQKVS